MTTYTFDTVSQALPVIMSTLLNEGDEVGSRNGRVKEILNAQIVIKNPTSREVISLNRNANVFAQIAETMWVLAGRNDIEWLSAYLPRAKDYSDDGQTWRGGYGPRIRKWYSAADLNDLYAPIDQLAHVVDLLKRDPLSRRAVISIYDPAVDTRSGKDIPCNDFIQFQNRLGSLHMTVTVRSNDAMWGWSGINAFEWSTLQEIVATLVGVNVGTLTFNIGSLHIYEPHWRKAERIEVDRADDYYSIPFDPQDRVTDLEQVDRMIARFFLWEDMCRKGIASPDMLEEDADDGGLFEEWSRAIAYYWTRDEAWLEPLRNTALAVAIARTPLSLLPEPVVASGGSASGAVAPTPAHPFCDRIRPFYEFATALHAEKHASYGDSWRKRGEQMSILANIARKVDRLGVGDSFDSSADTVLDLWVYCAKYLNWLQKNEDTPENVNQILGASLSETVGIREIETDWQTRIPLDFDFYAANIEALSDEDKAQFVEELLLRTAPLAMVLWEAEQDEYKGADVD